MRKHKFFAILFPMLGTVGLALMLSSTMLLVILGITISSFSTLCLAVLLFDAPIEATAPPIARPTVLPVPVSQRMAELEGLYNTLQSNYVRKTRELQDKIDDLERFHNLSIGRELRLIELKNEIQRLQAAHTPASPASPPAGQQV